MAKKNETTEPTVEQPKVDNEVEKIKVKNVNINRSDNKNNFGNKNDWIYRMDSISPIKENVIKALKSL